MQGDEGFKLVRSAAESDRRASNGPPASDGSARALPEDVLRAASWNGDDRRASRADGEPTFHQDPGPAPQEGVGRSERMRGGTPLTPRLRKSLLDRASSLPSKLVVPYALLTVITAMAGIFIITRLVTSSIRERFVNQLLEASRVAADSIVRRETFHLEQLRLIAFTQGVPTAISEADLETLQTLAYPILLNANVHSFSALSADGLEIMTLVQDPLSGDYAVSSGANLVGLPIVARIMEREVDGLGDKYAGIYQTIYGPYLLTSAPVAGPDGRLVGTLVMGTRLGDLLAEIKSQSLADVVLLDPLGQLMATTLAAPEEGLHVLMLSPPEFPQLDAGLNKELTLYLRQYQAYYSPLVVRQDAIGFMGVVLSSSFITSTESTSRNLFSLIFTLATVMIILLGYAISQMIARPIRRLRDVSLAVASGDLEQRSGIKGRDEIGQLAAVFDLMTFRLRRRTAQVTRLYGESLKRNDELADANQRLQTAQQRLVQSEKLASIGQLTAGIVHDVKNPLGIIKGLAEELEDILGPDSEHIADLRVIHSNADRASRIVSDLLKFARQSEPEMRKQELSATIQKVLTLTDFMARKGRVKVVSDLGTEPLMATFDAPQIEQVLVNLVQNAIQAMPDGGTLFVKASMNEGWIQVIIEDTGVGIPKHHIGRIFDPFFTTKPADEGTGLGLSVSYGIISEHNGRIDVDSTVGEGTRFTIHLRVNPWPAKQPAAE